MEATTNNTITESTYPGYIDGARVVTSAISEAAERGFDFDLGSFCNQALVPDMKASRQQ